MLPLYLHSFEVSQSYGKRVKFLFFAAQGDCGLRRALKGTAYLQVLFTFFADFSGVSSTYVYFSSKPGMCGEFIIQALLWLSGFQNLPAIYLLALIYTTDKPSSFNQ